MTKRHDALRSAVVANLLFLPALSHAQSLPPVQLSGDVRLRLEEDWDSDTPAGIQRPDRGRARVRARLGATMDLGDGFTLQARVRSGAEHSQQNANITFADFNGNPVDVFKIELDRASLNWARSGTAVDVGRVAFPFFTNNEYFWDADISPLGGDASVTVPVGGRTRLRLVGGGFLLPVGLAHYSGNLYAGQAITESGTATLAVGLFRFQADRQNPVRLLQLDDNGSRDYTVLGVNARYKVTVATKPVALTGDLFRNLQSYANDPDPVSQRFRNDRTGFVIGAAAGDTAPRHLQIGYRFFRMEKLAVDASYSHDDLARLGTASQAALTDLRGHDAYANYAFTKHLVAGIRAILSRRISDLESDKRARIDLSYSF